MEVPCDTGVFVERIRRLVADVFGDRSIHTSQRPHQGEGGPFGRAPVLMTVPRKVIRADRLTNLCLDVAHHLRADELVGLELLLVPQQPDEHFVVARARGPRESLRVVRYGRRLDQPDHVACQDGRPRRALTEPTLDLREACPDATERHIVLLRRDREVVDQVGVAPMPLFASYPLDRHAASASVDSRMNWYRGSTKRPSGALSVPIGLSGSGITIRTDDPSDATPR